ncbi:MAG TPA: gluconokinase, partial [Armatimonadota bacterium]
MPRPSATPCVLSLDIGTSSVRVLGYDTHGRLIPEVAASEEHAPDTTPDGGSTLDPDAVLERAFRCLDGALAKARELRREVVGVAACTFWHSVLPLDASGRPLGPLLMWSDTRSAAQAEGLKGALDEHAVHGRTGCVLHPSYVPAKMAWVRETQPQLAEARWVSIGEYLGLRTHGRLACSVSMASGTGLLDLRQRAWDSQVLAACGLSPDQLAPLVEPSEPSVGLTPEASARWPELAKVPWYPALGDGAASNLGCGATSSSRAALMVGTSGALRWVRCEGVPSPPWGLWAYLIDSNRYLYGGALSNGGNLAAWLRDTLRIPWGAELDAKLGALAPDGHGLTVLPFLAGERNPGWHGSARGTITGLSLHTTPAEI